MLDKIITTLFRIYRVIGRTIIKYSPNPRPASQPFITGDGFRKMAKYIFDDRTKNVEINKIKERDIIFVGDSNIKKFLTELHPKIKKPYILLTHNGDEAIDQELINLIDDKIIKWYGLNVVVDHPKIIPLPIGLANMHFYVTGILWPFKYVRRKIYKKSNKIFYSFIMSTNAHERQRALDILKSNPVAETISKWAIFPKYIDLLANYKFVVSPPGSSVEGHRTWEALAIKTIPIVKTSVTTRYFKKLNIPIWLIKNWHELENLTEDSLAKKYEEIMSKADWSKTYFNYWQDKILNLKD